MTKIKQSYTLTIVPATLILIKTHLIYLAMMFGPNWGGISFRKGTLGVRNPWKSVFGKRVEEEIGCLWMVTD